MRRFRPGMRVGLGPGLSAKSNALVFTGVIMRKVDKSRWEVIFNTPDGGRQSSTFDEGDMVILSDSAWDRESI